jgi:glycosyltransferase involved in cell wall biosynthesis
MNRVATDRRRTADWPDLVFVSLEDWDEIWRRNQFVCAELARRHPRMRILFLGVQRNVWQHIKRGQWRELLEDPLWQVPDLPNIYITRPLRIAPERFWWGRKFNEVLTYLHLRRAVRRCAIGRFVLWLNPHYAVHLVGRLGEAAVLYDVTDDWTSLTQEKSLAKLVVEQDRRLCNLADAVVVCSSRLYSMKASMAKQLWLIPNGVDAEHYRKVLDGDASPPAVTSQWTSPVLGYTGTIHPDRVDVAFVAALAAEFSHGTIVLVGPDMLNPPDRELLQRHPNVILTGPVPYAQIPSCMRAFDVCIVPHRMTAFTESLNPIKLWEYLAAGKPIVSTNIAGFRDYPELVRIAENVNAFADEVRAALKEGLELPQRRRAEARQNSWTSRVDMIEEVIQSCLQGLEAVGR